MIWSLKGKPLMFIFCISITSIFLVSTETDALAYFQLQKLPASSSIDEKHSCSENRVVEPHDNLHLAESAIVTSGKSRRNALRFLGKSIFLSSSALVVNIFDPCAVIAADDSAVVSTSIRSITEMKDFLDPVGLFSIRVPKSYFVLRRSSKGDLPDPKTGQGRRGSSIFSAGDMTKAEIVAIERYPVRALLEDEGIDSSGDLSTFTSIGKPEAVANLITRRRDRDSKRGQQTQTEILSVTVSPDAKTLLFTLRTTIEVMNPELLMEQTGMSQLIRITLAKATLASNDGQMMVVFASALKPDFDGPDGDALREAVSSFTALDQSRINQS